MGSKSIAHEAEGRMGYESVKDADNSTVLQKGQLC